MDFRFVFEEQQLAPAFARLSGFLGIAEGANATLVYVKKAPALRVARKGDEGFIGYSEKSEACRALALLCQHWNEGDFTLAQPRRFDACGLMLDCSRGAVAKPEAVETLLCRMALMGANLLMLYTEDTYEVKGRPYFGYLRGAYTQEELRYMDDCADMLGIELVPCIQTLAHMERALQWWGAFNPVRDTADTLYVGKEETYSLLEDMILAVTGPLRTNRIHIGMDEAFGLGLGQRLMDKGYTSPDALMREHLERVRDILCRHSLQAMMWSDMFFQACSPSMIAYAPGTVLTEEVLQQVPEEITQIYWHYSSETEQTYDEMLAQHDRMRAKTAFAGGLWSWTGPATDYRKAFLATPPALRQCERHSVREVFVTAWMDDGAEANMLTTLLGVQLYCEYNFTGRAALADVEPRFAACAGISAQAFYDIALLNVTPGLRLAQQSIANVCKMLLFEDPLMPIFEVDLAEAADATYFTGLAQRYTKTACSHPSYASLFHFYAALANVNAIKCQWRNEAAHAVRTKNRPAARQLAPLADAAIDALDMLAGRWRTLWFETNKPYGFEVIDMRLGGCIARFKSARYRLLAFAKGETDDIPELSCEKLPFLLNGQNEIEGNNNWARYISACRIV